MPWSGGSFTRTNGVNTGATLWAQDRDDGTKILATRHDTNDQDMADGINSTLEKSGSNAATGNLDIGSNRITLVADGTAKTDVATVNQIQSNGPAFQATDTGTANTYVIALTPAITAYAAGQEFTFKAGAASTTASTLNVNTLGAKALKKRNDQDIAAGDIEAGSIVTAVYDGTSFQVTSQLASDNAATADKLSTARTIASSGDVVWSVSFDGSAAVTSGAVIQASSVDGSMIALGSDASGDVMYYSGSAWARLAKGSDDEVLTLASGLPSWAAAAAGGVAVGVTPASVQVFTSSGTWTRPTGILTIVVTVVGSGGGGAGGSESGSDGVSGGGGGGGGYAIEKIDVASLASETVTIGAGGAGGSSGTIGVAGDTSSFGSYCSATGGGPGNPGSTSNYNGQGGVGGVGTGGNVQNGHGGPGTPYLRTYWGSGSPSGSCVGGATYLSLQSGSNTSHVYGCGGNGQTGSGGSGSSDNDGAAGVVVVWEYK
jgi:hypothetical protein